MLEGLLEAEQAVRLHVVDKLLERSLNLSVDEALPQAARVTAYVMDGTLPSQDDTSLAPARPATF